MPSTRARSAALRNGPALSRKATIRRRGGGDPEIRSRSASEPRLITSVVTGSAGRRPGRRWSDGVARLGVRGRAEKARFGAIRLSLDGPILPPPERRSVPNGPRGSALRQYAAPVPDPHPAAAGVPGPRPGPRLRSPGATGRARRTRLSRRASAAGGSPIRRGEPPRWPARVRRDHPDEVAGDASRGAAGPRDVRETAWVRMSEAGPERAHPKSRSGYFFAPDSSRMTAIITSPTACRLCALSLSGVSSTVCQRLLLLP